MYNWREMHTKPDSCKTAFPFHKSTHIRIVRQLKFFYRIGQSKLSRMDRKISIWCWVNFFPKIFGKFFCFIIYQINRYSAATRGS